MHVFFYSSCTWECRMFICWQFGPVDLDTHASFRPCWLQVRHFDWWDTRTTQNSINVDHAFFLSFFLSISVPWCIITDMSKRLVPWDHIDIKCGYNIGGMVVPIYFPKYPLLLLISSCSFLLQWLHCLILLYGFFFGESQHNFWDDTRECYHLLLLASHRCVYLVQVCVCCSQFAHKNFCKVCGWVGGWGQHPILLTGS